MTGAGTKWLCVEFEGFWFTSLRFDVILQTVRCRSRDGHAGDDKLNYSQRRKARRGSLVDSTSQLRPKLSSRVQASALFLPPATAAATLGSGRRSLGSLTWQGQKANIGASTVRIGFLKAVYKGYYKEAIRVL